MALTDFFKKSALFGLGVLSLSREKAEELASDLIKKGELSKEEGTNFINDILDKARKTETELEEKIKSAAARAVEKTGLASKKDIETLEKRITDLEKKLNKPV
ncbi:MAG: hypothetical protein A2096_05840 [Spirochaetes bacterium GWF1_41_5]|nr:MAG: hypothetical protein A2096_05840 [Spirochaetes bacterium GWF1_41_5]HBE04365.1 hypothetical protein [Spirochaetia bacterium]